MRSVERVEVRQRMRKREGLLARSLKSYHNAIKTTFFNFFYDLETLMMANPPSHSPQLPFQPNNLPFPSLTQSSSQPDLFLPGTASLVEELDSTFSRIHVMLIIKH